jgi:DNA-directed RNA polymerase specialized sigma24 family protein
LDAGDSRNAWLNTLRARRTRRRAEEAFGKELLDCTLAEMRASRSQLEHLFARIPSVAQEVVGECLVAGEEQATVAARSGMTKRAVEGAIYRARTALRGMGLEM